MTPTPASPTAQLKAERAAHSDTNLLTELCDLAALPDEGDAAWELDDTWDRALRLVALAELAAARRLAEAVALVLDRMCLGDPGEMMRSLRHAFEATVAPDWSRLTEICALRLSSDRSGTRYWALHELGILHDHSAMPAILDRFDDRDASVAEVAFCAAVMTAQHHPALRSRVVVALRRIARTRPVLAVEAERALGELQRTGPAIGPIDDPEREAALARAFTSYRGDRDTLRALGNALEGLLYPCLARCDEWDGVYALDGVLPDRVVVTAERTMELHGRLVMLHTGMVDRSEPLRATIELSRDGDAIDSATVRFGNAAIGLGSVAYGARTVEPADVTEWLFEFRK